MLSDNIGCVYLKKPEDFKEKFEAVSCYLIYQGKILFFERSDKDASEPNKWGVPTGRKRQRKNKKRLETDIETLIREIREETSINLFVYGDKFIYSNEFFMRYKKFDFICRTYFITLSFKPNIKLSAEHQRYDWFKLADAISSLKLVEGLKEILTYYEKKLLHEVIKYEI